MWLRRSSTDASTEVGQKGACENVISVVWRAPLFTALGKKKHGAHAHKMAMHHAMPMRNMERETCTRDLSVNNIFIVFVTMQSLAGETADLTLGGGTTIFLFSYI